MALICTTVLWSDSGAAKLKIYHCQSETGQIVIQDRACRITDLFNNSTDPKKKQENQKSQSKSFNRSKSKALQSRRNTFAAAANQKLTNNASHFLNSINQQKWQSQLVTKNFGWYLLLVSDDGQREPSVAAQMTVTYYTNTNKHFGRDAFAQALHFYHHIRNTSQLRDSQFVSHSDYKVFNVSYFSSGDRAYTEYYIHKNRPELWVITAKSSPRNWSLVWPDFVKIKSVL